MRQLLKVAALVACITLSSCSNNQSKPNHESSAAEQPIQAKTWQIGNYVNEFGEPTGYKYVYAELTNGSFSNSATQGSRLTALVQPFRQANIYGDTVGGVIFKLFEYGKHPVTRSGEMHIAVRGNDGNIIRGMVRVEDNGNILVPYDKRTGFSGDSIFSVLQAGGSVAFNFRSAKAPYSSYSFNIDNADGLMEALAASK